MKIRTILFIVPLLLCFSCGGKGHSAGAKALDSDSIARVRDGYCRTADGRLILRSLKALRYLNTADTVDLIDLSRQGLKEMPDLSSYNARALNLSANSLTGSFPTSRLPHGLRSLDLSRNHIDTLYFPHTLERLNVSRCGLKEISSDLSAKIGTTRLSLLDISYNKDVWGVDEVISSNIDTLITTGSPKFCWWWWYSLCQINAGEARYLPI